MGTALSWVTTVARLVLGVSLFVAGAIKIGAPAVSVQAVKAYQLLPDTAATFVGHGLPIVEMIVGVLLVLGLLARPSAVVGGLLMVAFIIGISSAWARGLRIDCGCFGGGGTVGADQDPGYIWELLRDAGYLLCAAWIIYKPPGRLAMDSALGLTGSRDADASFVGDEDGETD
ncbi:MauE/DoxX family redox-associated membrane protein [Planotetraspora thailandica]|uniref:MauE/DoxX family redox-associated membrane protein n=1 Tax=Planotetraspora thailandica TaxID=487172 RepID=UPI001EF2E9CA|nr:MauE/DoxX family redox-associated membrane protein [Planotetraspora thailandica]